MPTPENQKKIEYLSRYRKLGKRIEQLSTERAMWLSRACKTTQTISDMPKAKNGAQGDSSEVAQYIEIGEEITQELRELRCLRREILAVIATVKEDTLYNLMRYRYIDGLTFEQIAVKLDYGYRHIKRLHRKAIDVLVCPL